MKKKNLHITIALSCICALSVLVNCLHKSQKKESLQSFETKTAEIQTKLQEEFKNKFSTLDDSFSHAWGLFSEGGIAGHGDGQIWVFSNGQDKFEIYDASFNYSSQTREAKKQIERPSESAIKKFLQVSIKSATLKDFKAIAFDTFNYEYVELRKTKKENSIITKKRVVMKALDANQEANKQYYDLIAAFKNLQP
ncbi:MAG: hypothetical protein CMP11_06505 [Zetaproteobacteria bacterium]|nr:hypothetical protein [Pseudobdellovibrionaceae bacterium]|tara:strand:+ start:1824 stop:2408 length:585 start_codon:yes stop_codon:yes gene_type:complete